MKKELPYNLRLRLYESEKRELALKNLSAEEYERRIRELAKKYRI